MESAEGSRFGDRATSGASSDELQEDLSLSVLPSAPRSQRPLAGGGLVRAWTGPAAPKEELPQASIPSQARHSTTSLSSESSAVEEPPKRPSQLILSTSRSRVSMRSIANAEDNQRAARLSMSALGKAEEAAIIRETGLVRSGSSRLHILLVTEGIDTHGDDGDEEDRRALFSKRLNQFIRTLQRYSLPLIVGVLIALIWSNADQESYHKVVDSSWGFEIDSHPVSLHFVVNDFFMCFFFGLAIKEVTEALLPGGCLSPLSRAVNPIVATLGGVLGPVATYIAIMAIFDAAGALDLAACLPTDYHATHGDDHRRLAGGSNSGPPDSAYDSLCSLDQILRGWGVPTATDISLAWMFAMQIFGPGHPAINFMLLLAILDDALGMIIIAVFYSDPKKPVEPIWLLLVLAAAVLALLLRFLHVPFWQVYIAFCGPLSWAGLFKAHVHPALALVFVVPLMPASHAIEADDFERDLGARKSAAVFKERVVPFESPGSQDSLPDPDLEPEEEPPVTKFRSIRTIRKSLAQASYGLAAWWGVEEHAPLHVFEHSVKLPVDLGMFFFGLANAGVKLGSVGQVTAGVYIALLVGKMLGITLLSLLTVCLGFPLPSGLGLGDLLGLSALGAVGLTVALFVSNEAFDPPELRGQAKMGAVLSVTCGLVAWAVRKIVGGVPVRDD